MPCAKCSSDFNLFNWKLKCGECSDKYCSKCLKKNDGVFYCEKCVILLTRPPDRAKLMQLKSKDLQEYLSKHKISTYGLVEKQELVELLCRKHIPVKQKRGTEKLTANFAGSVPNIRNLNLFSDIDSVFQFSRQNEERVNQQQQSPIHPSAPSPSMRSTSSAPISPEPAEEPAPAPSEPQPTTSTGISSEKLTAPSSPKLPKLSDYQSVDDLSKLSPKCLKMLLTLNRVDYKGCVEKAELVERVERLWTDTVKAKNEDPPETIDDLCKLCMDAPLDCVLLECGHIATCIDCGKKLAECPICRQYVVRVVRTFKA